MFSLPKYTWDKDREVCKRCKHCRERIEDDRYHSKSVVMLCAANPYRGRNGIGSCIDNRTRGPCGKEALQFQPKEIG